MEKGYAMKKPVRYVRLDTPAEVCEVFAEYGREVRMKRVEKGEPFRGPDRPMMYDKETWVVAREVGGISNLEYVPLPIFMIPAGEAKTAILTQEEFRKQFEVCHEVDREG